MREFTSFAISFCGVCVATGGLQMLMPESKMTKAVKYAIVLTLISAMIGIFAVNYNIEFSSEPVKFDFTEEHADEKMITAVLKQALITNGIKFEKITVFTDNSEEGSINITKIQIYSSEDKDRIMSAIGNDNAYEVEIIK